MPKIYQVKVWDIRTGDLEQAVLSIEHQAPVEDVATLASGLAVCAAGGDRIAVYDIVGGGGRLLEASNHQVRWQRATSRRVWVLTASFRKRSRQ